jgi:hypothetical protein
MVYVNSAREPCRGAANPSQHWYESVDGSSLGAFVLAGEGVLSDCASDGSSSVWDER